MGKGAQIKVEAKTDVKRHVDKVIGRMKKLGAVTKKVNAGIQASIRGIGSLFRKTRVLGVAAVAAMAGIGLAVKTAFDFELAEKQFQVLLGSMEKAKERFRELKELSAGTPFELKNLIEASKTLEGFGLKGKENLKSLRLLGDAAAALDPGKLEEMALAFGRLFTGASVGLTGEPTMRLLELKVLAPKTKIEIDKLSKSAGNFEKVIGLAVRDLSRFTGGMKELSTTGRGLFSTLKDNWTLTLATFGNVFLDVAKDSIGGMIKKLSELRNDGSITKWAEATLAGLNKVKDVALVVAGAIATLSDASKRVDVFKAAGGVVLAAFLDGAEKAVNALKSAAPAIGEFIAEGFIKAINASFFGDPKAQEGASKADVQNRAARGGLGFDPTRPGSAPDRIPAARGGDKAEISRTEAALNEFVKVVSGGRQKVENLLASVDGPVNRRAMGDDDRARFIAQRQERDAAAQAKATAAAGSRKSTAELAGIAVSTFNMIMRKPSQRRFGPEMLGRGVKREPIEEPRAKPRRRRAKSVELVGATERRGISIGELFDIKQFGLGVSDDKLGTKQNPMVVALSEEPV